MTFVSEPLNFFLQAHSELNSFSKVTVAAVDYLSNSTEDSKELSSRINELILKAGERWTSSIIVEPHAYLNKVKNDLSKSAIVWAYSSFDVFFKQIEGYLSVSVDEEKAAEKEIDKEEDCNVVRLYYKLGWDKTNIDKVVPIYKFYKVLRNCIAHNLGIPTAQLIELSSSKRFIDAIDKWETKYKGKSISLPPVVTDTRIDLKPHHAITYSETCRRIAEDMNLKLLDVLGVGFFVEKTIKKHLHTNSNLSVPVCRDYTTYIITHIFQDYQLKVTFEDLRRYYTDINQRKKDNNKYEMLKKKPQK